MFTGIVEGIGRVEKVDRKKSHTRLEVRVPFSLKDTRLGDSIAVDGCCLTVSAKKGRTFSADLSPETLEKTSLKGLKRGARVNLERPLRMGDRLGGHLVQGHVDGTGTMVSSEKIEAKPEAYYLIEVKVPRRMLRYMVPKGSIAVDGISLTLNEVKGQIISLCIIPHTQELTTLTEKKAGATLNLECDILLKFIENILQPTVKRWEKKITKKE